MTTGSFCLIDPDDMSAASAWDFFKYDLDRKRNVHEDQQDGTGVAGTALKVDASYALSDALSVGATVETIVDGAIYGTAGYNAAGNWVAAGTELTEKQLLSYKLSVEDQLTEALKLSGWYAGYGDLSEIGVKGEYTFIDGLVDSLGVKSNSNTGESEIGYIAKITITL